MLPSVVPLPTMWMEEERDLLFMGTSLEVSQEFHSKLSYHAVAHLRPHTLGFCLYLSTSLVEIVK